MHLIHIKNHGTLRGRGLIAETSAWVDEDDAPAAIMFAVRQAVRLMDV